MKNAASRKEMTMTTTMKNYLASGKHTAPRPTDVAALEHAIATGDWSAFARIVVAFSGGKDSLARQKFPQVAADLKVRWCSAYLKIDVACKVFANDPRFNRNEGELFLLVTGERREEGTVNAKTGKASGRATYAEIERDRSATQKRNVLRWRAAIDMTETEVWELIERHGIVPHPAYVLGFGRVSCAACIFGNADQWASVQDLLPEQFERVAGSGSL